LANVPQYDPSPRIVTEIEQRLNSPIPDTAKLKSLISQLRYWLTERRCEMTLQHLPASASDKITLLKWEENPILRRIGPHRLTVKFQKHPYAILVSLRWLSHFSEFGN
jgi:mediator of RNA polymerase II transcription subunit 14